MKIFLPVIEKTWSTICKTHFRQQCIRKIFKSVKLNHVAWRHTWVPLELFLQQEGILPSVKNSDKTLYFVFSVLSLLSAQSLFLTTIGSRAINSSRLSGHWNTGYYPLVITCCDVTIPAVTSQKYFIKFEIWLEKTLLQGGNKMAYTETLIQSMALLKVSTSRRCRLAFPTSTNILAHSYLWGWTYLRINIYPQNHVEDKYIC